MRFEMSELVKTPTRFFYWQIKFNDNYILSQFDKEGNEVFIKAFTPKSCWVLQQNGSLKLDYNSNWFELLESTHGHVIKVSWMPFTKELKSAIQNKQPNFECEVVKEYRPIERRVPKEMFGHIAWSNKILQRIEMIFDKSPRIEDGGTIDQYQAVLFIGYLPRDEAILEGRRGKIDQIIIEARSK